MAHSGFRVNYKVMCTNHVKDNKATYVLMTAAFNEAKYIEATILSVISQTVLPLRWVIASDGSTDGTDAIIKKYCKENSFIVYVRIDQTEGGQESHIGMVARRKVYALREAFTRLSALEYGFIGNIDADVSINSSFFERLLEKFCETPQLGVGGGFVYNVFGDKLVPYCCNQRNVAGALQLFRKECYYAIGGYAPYGHEDTIALIMARMRGWAVRSFDNLKVLHHKSAGCTGSLRYKAKYRLGAYDYILSDCLAWEFLRCFKEVRDTPYIIGSCLRLFGYFKAMLEGKKILPLEVQIFVRREQYRLIRDFIRGKEER